jgi:hypothetical protein
VSGELINRGGEQGGDGSLDELQHFVVDESWEAYCDRMSQRGQWGDNLTLLALANELNCCIVIVSSSEGDESCIQRIQPRNGVSETSLLLCHRVEYHYDSLERIGTALANVHTAFLTASRCACRVQNRHRRRNVDGATARWSSPPKQ